VISLPTSPLRAARHACAGELHPAQVGRLLAQDVRVGYISTSVLPRSRRARRPCAWRPPARGARSASARWDSAVRRGSCRACWPGRRVDPRIDGADLLDKLVVEREGERTFGIRSGMSPLILATDEHWWHR
jgi:hypothetical protein